MASLKSLVRLTDYIKLSSSSCQNAYAPNYVHKIFAFIIMYYIFRIIIMIIQANINKKKIAMRRLRSKKRFGVLNTHLGVAQVKIDESIADLSFQEVWTKLQDKSLKPSQVLIAYRETALAADIVTNAVTDTIDEVSGQEMITFLNEQPTSSALWPFKNFLTSQLNGFINWKRSLSDTSVSTAGLYSSNSYAPEKLLYGIPVSLSEVIQIKNDDATAGFSILIDKLASEDAVVVQLLRAQGAIPFIRTNVPQTCFLLFGSSNPIYGMTRNPIRTLRSPGGTSCGEGSIISAKGSLLGVGTDLAGGIRIPAHFCGVCGLKPTSIRVSTKGVFQAVEGQTAISLSIGPLARDVDGLVAFMKSVCVPLQNQLDPLIPTVPFNHEIFESDRPLIIGFFIDDGYTKCSPAVRRTVMEAKEILESCGHSVIPFSPPDLKDMLVKLYLPALLGDQSNAILSYLATDCVDSSVRSTYYAALVPSFVWWLLSYFYAEKNPMDAAVMALNPPQTVEEWWQLVSDIAIWRQQFIMQWQSQNVDVLLCPVMHFAALKLGNEERFQACLTYTALFNLLDFPAGTVPVSKVTEADLDTLKDPTLYEVTSLLEKALKKDQTEAEVNPESSALNLPVGVQVVALPFQEELVLRVLKELEQELKKHSS